MDSRGRMDMDDLIYRSAFLAERAVRAEALLRECRGNWDRPEFDGAGWDARVDAFLGAQEATAGVPATGVGGCGEGAVWFSPKTAY